MVHSVSARSTSLPVLSVVWDASSDSGAVASKVSRTAGAPVGSSAAMARTSEESSGGQYRVSRSSVDILALLSSGREKLAMCSAVTKRRHGHRVPSSRSQCRSCLAYSAIHVKGQFGSVRPAFSLLSASNRPHQGCRSISTIADTGTRRAPRRPLSDRPARPSTARRCTCAAVRDAPR